MRLLITGASGGLGARLCLAHVSTWDVVGTYLTRRDCVPPTVSAVSVDLRDASAVAAMFAEVRPDAVVHAAAMANVQLCQMAPAEAAACNRDATRYVARYARGLDVPMVYLSTDLVFEGDRGWYSDIDTPTPICVYGASKQAGEGAAREEHPDSCVLRVSLTYGWTVNARHGFLELLIAALRRGERVAAFVDEYRTPVLVEDLCATVSAALSAGLTGTYHVAGPRRLSRYALALEAARAFDLSTDGVVPSPRGDNNAFRPRDCSLLASAPLREIGQSYRDPIEGLRHMASTERKPV